MPPPLDLSEATNLETLEFQWSRPDVQWIVTSLKSIRSQNLQEILLNMYVCVVFPDPVEERIYREWRDLDRLLAGLWDSYAIIPKMTYFKVGETDELGRLLPSLLPELTS